MPPRRSPAAKKGKKPAEEEATQKLLVGNDGAKQAPAAAQHDDSSSDDGDNTPPSPRSSRARDEDDLVVKPEGASESLEQLHCRAVAIAVLRRVVARRRARAAALGSDAATPVARKKPAGKAAAAAAAAASSAAAAACAVPQLTLDMLRAAAQTPQMGVVSGGVVPIASCLCAVGFHAAGSGPLLAAPAQFLPSEQDLAASLAAGELSSPAAASAKGGAKRRQRTAAESGAAGDEDAPGDGVPREWQREIVCFPDCSHCCCRTCAVNALTVELAARPAAAANKGGGGGIDQQLALECSFCNGRSSLCLRVPAEAEAAAAACTVRDRVAQLFAEQFPVPGGADAAFMGAVATGGKPEQLTAARSWTMFLAQAERVVEDRNTDVAASARANNEDGDADDNNGLPAQTPCGICEERVETADVVVCTNCCFAICGPCAKGVHSKGMFKTHAVVPPSSAEGRSIVRGEVTARSSAVAAAATSSGSQRNSFADLGGPSAVSTSALAASRFCSKEGHERYPLDFFCTVCSTTICLMCTYRGGHSHPEEQQQQQQQNSNGSTGSVDSFGFGGSSSHNNNGGGNNSSWCVKPLSEVMLEARQGMYQTCNELKAGGALDGVRAFHATLAARSAHVVQHAEQVRRACDGVFARLHRELDARQDALGRRIAAWEGGAQATAGNDGTVMALLLQALVDVLRVGEAVTSASEDAGTADASSSQQQQKQQQSAAAAGVITSAVAADTLSLRDALRFRVGRLLQSPLVQQVQQRFVREDGDRQQGVDALLRGAACKSTSTSNTEQPAFGAVPDEIAQLLSRFLDDNTDRALTLPQWLSFVDLIAGIAHKQHAQRQQVPQLQLQQQPLVSAHQHQHQHQQLQGHSPRRMAPQPELLYGDGNPPQFAPASTGSNNQSSSLSSGGSSARGSGQFNNIGRLQDPDFTSTAMPVSPSHRGSNQPQSRAGAVAGVAPSAGEPTPSQHQAQQHVLQSSLFAAAVAPNPQQQQQQQQRPGAAAPGGPNNNAQGGRSARSNPFAMHFR